MPSQPATDLGEGNCSMYYVEFFSLPSVMRMPVQQPAISIMSLWNQRLKPRGAFWTRTQRGRRGHSFLEASLGDEIVQVGDAPGFEHELLVPLGEGNVAYPGASEAPHLHLRLDGLLVKPGNKQSMHVRFYVIIWSSH